MVLRFSPSHRIAGEVPACWRAGGRGGGGRCGNTTNANHPVMQRLIMDSLRQWVEEYHVDGFRFDLASVMCRDSRGHPVDSPPIVRAIAKDPVLSRVGPPPPPALAPGACPRPMRAMEQR